ncbi:hypothetical protein A6R68_10196, partial [Neotoma lepida]
LRASGLDSTSEPESKQTEGLNEEPVSDPSPVSDSHNLLSASPSQNELSAARILQSTDIIPQPLLDQFVSMTDPARAQTVDTDIAKHCAYSLPGVALTLGRQNWHCLKDTYETLASDGQLLHEDKRRKHLRQLQEFVVTDNSRNWRFRYELAEQLILILDLYGPSDIHGYLRHVALKLCADKVSQVRWISFKLVVAMLQKFYSHDACALGLSFIQELISRFRHCPNEESVPVDQFVDYLLPSLLSLASDPVPNVRVLLAKALQQTLLEK